MKQVIFNDLFSCGEYLISKTKEMKYEMSIINNQNIINVPFNFPEEIEIYKCFETTQSETYIPGYAIESNQGHYFISFFDNENPIFEVLDNERFIPYNKSIILDSSVQMIISNDELVLKNDSTVLSKGIPDDGYFICNNTRRGLIISNKMPFALITTKKKVINFPSGFSLKMTCASFVDNDTIAFATNNNMIHLYSLDGDIKSIKLKSCALKIETANINCYEPVCICLTNDYELINVNFLSLTVTLLASNIIDFCVIHSSFDQIIIKNNNEEKSILKLK